MAGKAITSLTTGLEDPQKVNAFGELRQGAQAEAGEGPDQDWRRRRRPSSAFSVRRPFFAA
jgi:hypothetical protein